MAKCGLQLREQLESGQKCDEVRFLLRCQDQAEAVFVKMHDVQQSLCGAIMEIRRARSQPAQDRAFDLADMVELAVDQSLAEIRRSFAVAGRRGRVRT